MPHLENPFGAEFGDLNSTPLALFEAELRACLVRNNGFASLPVDEVLEIYRHNLVGPLGDSERYWLRLPRLAAFTGETVRRLQNDVLRKFPEWTIALEQQCLECQEVFIRHDAVRTNSATDIDDLDAFMDELRSLERKARERVEGSVLRQFEYVRPMIPGLLHLVTDETPCIVVAAFDNWRGDMDVLCVWSLSRTTDWNVTIPGTRGASGGSFPVTDDGIAISRESDIKTYRQLRSTANLWLVQSGIRASYPGDAFVCEGPIPSDGSKPTEFPITIERSTFLRDRDLPRIELP